MTEPQDGTPEYWAQRRPDAIAVINGDETLTYRDWNERADRVAEGLHRAGLRSGDRLGMRFRLSIEWFVIQRALQKLGVAQVAVSWKLTAGEAAYILRDSGARGIACNDKDVSEWAAVDAGLVVTVGQAPGAFGTRYEDLVETPAATPRYGPLAPRLVLYTSGTTGAPRGVPPHEIHEGSDTRRLMRYRASVEGIPEYPEPSTALLTLPIHHGAGPASTSRVCRRGGTVVLLDPYDPERALELIERHQINTWSSVPTMLLRIRALPEEVLDRYDWSSLQMVSVGAAPVPQSLKNWMMERFGPILWEAYGASEAGMIAYVRPEFQLEKPGTSGRPYDGVDICIVDSDWTRLPVGTVGEIAVNTPTVLDHYLGGPPLGDGVVRDGYYRTGDVGFLDDDGFLYITDRIKDMIVAGGVNIYPAEIEKVLVEHPDVQDAAVIGIPHEDFGEQPLAFVVTRGGATATSDDLHAFLDGRLAKFKRPQRFEFVDDLPRNPTGKVLKGELREPYWRGRSRNV